MDRILIFTKNQKTILRNFRKSFLIPLNGGH